MATPVQQPVNATVLASVKARSRNRNERPLRTRAKPFDVENPTIIDPTMTQKTLSAKATTIMLSAIAAMETAICQRFSSCERMPNEIPPKNPANTQQLNTVLPTTGEPKPESTTSEGMRKEFNALAEKNVTANSAAPTA